MKATTKVGADALVGLVACRTADNAVTIQGTVKAVVGGGLFLQPEGRVWISFLGWEEMERLKFMTRAQAVRLNETTWATYEAKTRKANEAAERERLDWIKAHPERKGTWDDATKV